MLRRDLFVLYVVCTIFAEDRMRFVNLCGQIRTIAFLFHYLCDRIRPKNCEQAPVFFSAFTIFVAFSKIAL